MTDLRCGKRQDHPAHTWTRPAHIRGCRLAPARTYTDFDDRRHEELREDWS